MWKIHINANPKKPDTLAALYWVGRGGGAASASNPEELGVPALSALTSPWPFLSFWNAAACGRACDGWEREAEQEALKALCQYQSISSLSSQRSLWSPIL